MKFLQHFFAATIITIIMGVVYISVQQLYRSNADDPQRQMLQDMGDHLRQGKRISLTDTVSLEKSLSVFVETFDSAGHPLQSTGFLNGQFPRLPQGLFEYAKVHGEHWVTWQPQRGVRMAVGLVSIGKDNIGYLAAGRSLRETEERESRLRIMVSIAWLFCIAIVLISGYVSYKRNKNK